MPTTSGGIYYEEHGAGSDTLLWIHGFGSSTRGWKDIIQAFPEYRSIAIDLPGFGRSCAAGDGCRFPKLAAAAHNVMAGLGIDRYSVIGMSMGGGVALRLALDHPEAVRLVIGVVPYPAQGMAGEASDEIATAMAALHGNADALRAAYAGMSKYPPTSALDDLVEDSCSANRETWLDMMTGGGARFSQFDELGSLSTPFCSIIGADDVVLSVADQLATAAAVPGGRAVVLSGLGHLMGAEDPDRVIEEIRTSLSLLQRAAA
jgi:pimeloyl-ACP methyl ester carboxylesterase